MLVRRVFRYLYLVVPREYKMKGRSDKCGRAHYLSIGVMKIFHGVMLSFDGPPACCPLTNLHQPQPAPARPIYHDRYRLSTTIYNYRQREKHKTATMPEQIAEHHQTSNTAVFYAVLSKKMSYFTCSFDS